MNTRLQRIGIFVDVQNVYYTCKEAFQAKFDYRGFWAEVTAGREVVLAWAYATTRGDPQQQQFQDILRSIGFTVKLKPLLQRADGSAKGDWDVGIALDVYEQAAKCDTVVLVSGDGDFALLLERIRARFRTGSEVYGVEALTSDLLITAADKFRAIDQGLLLR